MSDETSLYNRSDGKTAAVNKYVKSLHPPQFAGPIHQSRFYTIKQKALEASHPDEKLKIMGYNPKKSPGIFEETK